MALPGVSVLHGAAGSARTPNAFNWAIKASSSCSMRFVALLVQGVDAPLYADDFRVACLGIAGDVFFVPEQVIGTMLHANQRQKALVPLVGHGLPMPAHDALAVQFGDRGNGNIGHGCCSCRVSGVSREPHQFVVLRS